ncbi:lipopolysaccharide biosynthesis protein [Thermococcus aggregans]|uniref:Lipopolysaccharide biosynthesis protein n=1 Tax=Thermococcus aggregans TaxID=110163 RepID=A0A9E7SNX5_THEAG|nr:lipopolysaccharide biosynthesis protein [Thermococcus aggregans]USS40781.1 lipopolysaccharide biosynthesis protein [Thermococcus aggregans]
MSYEKKVMLRHSIASIVALALFGLSRFIYSIVISRRFGVEVLGKVNSLISQAFLLAVPLSFFAVALGKYASEFLGKGDIEKIKSMTVLGFSFPFIGLALIPFNFYLAILAVLRALQLTFRSFIYGLHRGEIYAYAMLGAFILFIGGFFSENYYLPYIGLLSGVAIFGFVYLFKEKLFGKPSLNVFKLLLKYSSFAFLGTISGVFLVQAPYFLSEKLASPKVAGIVSASLSAAFLLTYLPQVFQSAIMPLYSYKYGKDDMEYVKWLAEESTKTLSLLVALVVFSLLLVGREILSILFGFRLGSEFYLALIAVETYIAYNPSIVALNSTKYVKEGTVITLLGASVSLIAWLLLIEPFKEYGAVLGLFLGYLSILIGTFYMANKKLKVAFDCYAQFVAAILLQSTVFISKSLLLLAFMIYLWLFRKEIGKMLNLIKLFRGRGF